MSATIVEQAKKDLPSAAVPTYVYPLKVMPLTVNGKADKAKLTSELTPSSLEEANTMITAMLSALTPVYKTKTVLYHGDGMMHTFLALVRGDEKVPTLAKDADFLIRQRLPKEYHPKEVHLLAQWPKGRKVCGESLRMDELLPEYLQTRKWGPLYRLTIQILQNGENIDGRYLDLVSYDASDKRVVSAVFISDDPIPEHALEATDANKHIHQELIENYLKPGKHPFDTLPKASVVPAA